MFFSDENRSFDYFLLQTDDYREQVQVPESYIDNAYADYLSSASGSDEIRFSHIMIEKSNHSSDEAAFEVISEVYSKLKNGDNFSELAMAYSDDVVTKEIGGDLEYFDVDVFPQEFADALKDLSINELSSIVELEDTLHVLKVTELNTTLSVVPMSCPIPTFIIHELEPSKSFSVNGVLLSDKETPVPDLIVSGFFTLKIKSDIIIPKN